MLGKFFEETQWLPRSQSRWRAPSLHAIQFSGPPHHERIARKAGAATDTSRDYDYTDWVGLDKFVEELAEEIRRSPAQAVRSEASVKTAARAEAPGHA